MRSHDPLHPPDRDRTFSLAGSASICFWQHQERHYYSSHRQRLLAKPTVFYPLVKACDVLPLLLLPEVISLQLKVSHQLHSCHFLPTQWHNLTYDVKQQSKKAHQPSLTCPTDYRASDMRMTGGQTHPCCTIEILIILALRSKSSWFWRTYL